MCARTAVLLATALSLVALAAAPPPVKVGLAGEAEVRDLIRQLSSEDFKAREAATRRLQGMEEAEPALRQALRSTDAEVVRRARSILTVLTGRQLARIKAEAKEGPVDLLAERLVHWTGRDEEPAIWQAVLDVGWGLIHWEGRQVKRMKHRWLSAFFPRPDHDSNQPVYLSGRGPTLEVRSFDRPGSVRGSAARAEGMSVQAGVNKSLIVASGRASLHRTCDSIVLCGGPVVLEGGSERLVIVCDGDLTVRGSIRQSILVARGEVRFLEAAVKRVRRGEEHYTETKKYNLAPDVRIDEAAVLNVVLAGGDVHVAEKGVICNSTVRTAGAIRLGKGAREWENELKERASDALSPVRFFTPKDAGLEVEPSRLGLRVSGVDRGRPFAQAGLRVDDLLLALDGQPVRTPDAFRKLLRKRVAEGGAGVFQVRRGGKSTEVRVHF